MQQACQTDCFSVKLTNRFHVAVHLLSNKSQMASKCGKNKKVPPGASCSKAD